MSIIAFCIIYFSFSFFFHVFKSLKGSDKSSEITVVFRKSRNNPGLYGALRKFHKTLKCVVVDKLVDYNLALHVRPRRQVLLQPRVISLAHLGSRVTWWSSPTTECT